MKKFILLIFILFLLLLPTPYSLCPTPSFAVDIKISELPANTAPTIDDLMVIVNDPSGTPATQKVTIENFIKANIYKKIVMPEWYGAVGDCDPDDPTGTPGTDDTTALQAAMTAAGTHGTVLFSKFYRTTANDLHTVLDGQQFIGMGWKTGIYCDQTDGGSNNQLFLVTGAVSGIRFSNFYIKGRQDDAGAGFSGRGISIESTNDRTSWAACPNGITIENMKFNDGHGAIWIGVEPGPVQIAKYTPWGIHINQVEIRDNEYPLEIYANRGDVTVEGLRIYEEGRIHRPIALMSAPLVNMSDVYVEGIKVKNPSGTSSIATGIYVRGWNHNSNFNDIIFNQGGEIVFSPGTGYAEDFATTAVNTSNETITVGDATYYPTSHPVVFTSGGTLPTGLTANVTYYSTYVDGTTIKLSTSIPYVYAGTYVNLEDQGSGTHNISNRPEIYAINANNVTSYGAGGIYFDNASGNVGDISGINLGNAALNDGANLTIYNATNLSLFNLVAKGSQIDIRGYKKLRFIGGGINSINQDAGMEIKTANGDGLLFNNFDFYMKAAKYGALFSSGIHNGVLFDGCTFRSPTAGSGIGIQVQGSTVKNLKVTNSISQISAILDTSTAGIVHGSVCKSDNTILNGSAIGNSAGTTLVGEFYGRLLTAPALAAGTTAGKVKSKIGFSYKIGDSIYYKPATDDLWDLTGLTDLTTNYAKVLLLIDSAGTCTAQDGTHGATLADAAFPRLADDQVIVGYLTIGDGTAHDWSAEAVTADGGVLYSGIPNLDSYPTAPFSITAEWQPVHASLTSLSGLTETLGGIPYGTADNAYAWLAAGTANYLLQGNGAAAPSWTNAPTVSAANMTSFPTLNQNTSGTAANVSGTPALPNGTTATTQSQADNTTKIATTAYVDAGLGAKGVIAGQTWTGTHAFNGTTTIGDAGDDIKVNLNTNAGDGTWSGLTITGTVKTDSAAELFGQAMFINSSGELEAADADATTSMPAVCLLVVAGEGAGKACLINGTITETDWNWTPGAKIYVGTDPATTCGLTATAPSGTGDVVQIIGIALSADTILVMPSLTMVEIL